MDVVFGVFLWVDVRTIFEFSALNVAWFVHDVFVEIFVMFLGRDPYNFEIESTAWTGVAEGFVSAVLTTGESVVEFSAESDEDFFRRL